MTKASNRKLVAGLTALAIGSISLIVWLFGPTPAEPKAPVNVASLPAIDGTLVEVELPRLVMKSFRPIDGKTELEFIVREQDRENFDVAHLRSHSSIGLPTRIYYLQEEGKLYAVFKEDAPANSRRESQP